MGRALSGFPDDASASDVLCLDHSTLKVASTVKPGDAFAYVFDLGDNWRHRCEVQLDEADPMVELGLVPTEPVAFWGWGWIPDQYGREALDHEDE